MLLEEELGPDQEGGGPRARRCVQSKATQGEFLSARSPAGSLVLEGPMIAKQASILALFQMGSKRNLP